MIKALIQIFIVVLGSQLLWVCNSPDHTQAGMAHSIVPGSLNHDYVIKVPVNLLESTIAWKGTKLMGTGSHEGTVKLKKGALWFQGDALAGGEFTVDMTTIYNTDIPLNDPVPRKNLTRHLNSDFETGLFPEAHFKITYVQLLAPSKFQIGGDLTIKGITRPISLLAEDVISGKEYHAQFTFNRFDWSIGEDGSWLEKKLVDKEVLVGVKIVL